MAKLKTETNTAAMTERIRQAFEVSDEAVGHEEIGVHFEHGQHWATCEACGAAWSVVDAEGPGTVDGFDFEQVSHGDESCRG